MGEQTAQRDFNLAVQHFRAGRTTEAESICRWILLTMPDHVGTLRLSGLLALQGGRHADAQHHLRRAVALAPTVADLHNDLGSALAASGQLETALSAFRSAWLLDPQNPDIACNLGMALMQMQAAAEAAGVYAQAARLRPNDPQVRFFLGDALREAGRVEEAVIAYRAAVDLDAHNAQSHLRLGLGLKAAGRMEDALASYQRAAELSPQLAEAHFNLGNSLKEQKRLPEAAEAYCRALTARPDYAEALHNLAAVFDESGRWDEAIVAFRQVIKLRPDFQSAYHGLGLALKSKGSFEKALAALRHAVALDPNSFESVAALTELLDEMGLDWEAAELSQRGLELRPDDPVALVYCGSLQERVRNPDAAGQLYHRAMQLRPDYPEAEMSLGMSLLLQGKFDEGWKAYEARLQVGKERLDWTELPQPHWNGEDLHGQRLLLHREQGIGDTIQFIRYAPLLVDRGARVMVRCKPSLHRLFSQHLGIERVLAEDEPLPDFDMHLSLLSLPRIFGTTLDSIPATVPYLMPPAELIALWRNRLANDSAVLKVGLVWAGSPKFRHDFARSVRFEALAPLLSTPQVSFYSLQAGPARDQITASRDGDSVTDLADELHDFADTAAAIMNLDLIVTVDTAVAHLAGALGRPTWVLLCHGSEWRWLLHRSDSPWYPTMRLFHQERPGDWMSVVRGVARELLFYPRR